MMQDTHRPKRNERAQSTDGVNPRVRHGRAPLQSSRALVFLFLAQAVFARQPTPLNRGRARGRGRLPNFGIWVKSASSLPGPFVPLRRVLTAMMIRPWLLIPLFPSAPIFVRSAPRWLSCAGAIAISMNGSATIALNAWLKSNTRC